MRIQIHSRECIIKPYVTEHLFKKLEVAPTESFHTDCDRKQRTKRLLKIEAVVELYLVDVALHPDFFLEVVEFAAAYQFGIDIVGMEDEPLELYTVFAVAYCNKYGTNTPEDVATKATRKIFNLLFPDNVFIYNTEAQTTSSTTLRS